MPRVLHVLAQRPSLTGSGVTLDALVRLAGEAGWQQRVVVGTPADEPHPTVGGLAREAVAPVLFEKPPLDFPLPGMSDVMPYRSSRWSDLSERQLGAYREVWQRHLEEQVEGFRPDVVHCHHLWLVSSWLDAIAPDVPNVVHCHATGLRQLELCPHLASEVVEGCRKADRIVTLHGADAQRVSSVLEVPIENVDVVGAGYREELFHDRSREPAKLPRVVYAGKLSRAKGLPWLIDAVETLRRRGLRLELHVAGGGSDAESVELRRRLEQTPGFVAHGQLDQETLAALLRAAAIFVLPSFYEGLPLVLVEAAACGCRVVATDLPGVRELAAGLEGRLQVVRPPRLERVDRPREEDLESFTAELAEAIAAGLEAGEAGAVGSGLDAWRWSGIFRRVESVWRELIGAGRRGRDESAACAEGEAESEPDEERRQRPPQEPP